jgi:hypothetical protein
MTHRELIWTCGCWTLGSDRSRSLAWAGRRKLVGHGAAKAGPSEPLGESEAATAAGEAATASGEAATAAGEAATAAGEAATAAGEASTASGEAATASGEAATASGEADAVGQR